MKTITFEPLKEATINIEKLERNSIVGYVANDGGVKALMVARKSHETSYWYFANLFNHFAELTTHYVNLKDAIHYIRSSYPREEITWLQFESEREALEYALTLR